MRWFSVNELWHTRSSEFWALKMLLQHHSGDASDEPLAYMEDPADMMRKNPREELQALRAAYGGLKLAEKLITGWLRSHMAIYYHCTKASWTWYCQQQDRVKQPKHALREHVRLAGGGWQEEIDEILKTCLSNPEDLAGMGLGRGECASDRLVEATTKQKKKQKNASDRLVDDDFFLPAGWGRKNEQKRKKEKRKKRKNEPKRNKKEKNRKKKTQEKRKKKKQEKRNKHEQKKKNEQNKKTIKHEKKEKERKQKKRKKVGRRRLGREGVRLCEPPERQPGLVELDPRGASVLLCDPLLEVDRQERTGDAKK